MPSTGKGAADPAGEAAEVSVETGHPLAVVCRVLEAPRSTVYARRLRRTSPPARPGPATAVADDELVRLIRGVIAESPFCGEGYRKVRARLRREHGVGVSGKRVLRVMRLYCLLAPQRQRRRRVERPTWAASSPRLPGCAGAWTPPRPEPKTMAG